MTRQWLHNHRLVIFGVPNFSRPTIDTWIDAVKEIVNQHTGPRLYILHDNTVSGMMIMPPYMQSRAKELTDVRPELPIYAAVVLPKSFLTQLMRRFLDGQKRNSSLIRFFFSRQEALKWLEEKLAEHG